MAKETGHIRQVLSAGAVVLSLIFVGFEIRQNTAAQRAQTRQALADGSRELVLTLATDPILLRAYRGVFPLSDGQSPTEGLAPSDSSQARMLMFAQLRNAENVFMQYREGVVDESVLRTYAFTDPRYQTSVFAEYWRQQTVRLDPGFAKAFEEANGIGRAP
jgi:hypothetical protein